MDYMLDIYLKSGLLLTCIFGVCKGGETILVLEDTASFKCDSIEEKSALRLLKRVTFTPDEKLSLLRKKGGFFSQTYFAVNEEDADEFQNPLVPTPHQEENSQSLQSTKLDILRELQDLIESSSLQLENGLAEAGIDQNAFDKGTKRTSADTNSKNEGYEPSHQTFLSGIADNEKQNRANLRVSHSRRRRRRHASTSSPVSPRDLYELPDEKTRLLLDTSGTQTTLIDYCLPRGSSTIDGAYLHMCSICAATTRLPEGIFFPSIINEAICSPSDRNCFVSNGIPHGICRQHFITFNILRKRVGYCTLALRDDQVVVADEWELVPYNVRAGCECVINKTSMFAVFV